MSTRLPSYSNDAGLLVSGVGESFSLLTVDGLKSGFSGARIRYMRNSPFVTKIGKESSEQDRIVIPACDKNLKFNEGDLIEDEYGERYIVMNEPQISFGAIWLDVKHAKTTHGGKRGMYGQ